MVIWGTVYCCFTHISESSVLPLEKMLRRTIPRSTGVPSLKPGMRSCPRTGAALRWYPVFAPMACWKIHDMIGSRENIICIPQLLSVPLKHHWGYSIAMSDWYVWWFWASKFAWALQIWWNMSSTLSAQNQRANGTSKRGGERFDSSLISWVLKE